MQIAKVIAGWLLCIFAAACGTEASRFRSLPEPHGHTAQISPHLPNRDREWYTEYRWKDKNAPAYEPQDGSITTQPKHARIPKHVLEERHHDQWGKTFDKPQQSSTSSSPSKVGVNGTGGAPIKKSGGKCGSNGTDCNAIKAKSPSGNATSGQQGAMQAVKQEPYAVPKPCGHTAMVHPFNSDRDREWHTEYRWKPGSEYVPQDGAITEKPKSALRGITRSPNGEPCVPIRA